MVGFAYQNISMRKLGLELISLVLNLSLLCLICEGIGYPKPTNCGLLECPPYDVIHSQDEFEIRAYSDAIWMTAPKIDSHSYKNASDTGFLKLFSYVSGKNKEAKRIGMTAPVIVDIYPSSKPSGDSSFVVHFYLPQEFQKNPPHSDEIQPVKLPLHKYVAVRRFGGFMDDKTIAPQLELLKKSLKGTPYESAINSLPYSVAGYNAPFEAKDRVNEVMLWFDKQ